MEDFVRSLTRSLHVRVRDDMRLVYFSAASNDPIPGLYP